jgi:hypothetical protein
MTTKKLLIAISIVVGVFAAAGVYNLYCSMRTRAEQPCINTLRQIEGAKEQWALEAHALPGAPVTLSNILPYLSVPPTCHVAAAPYIIGRVGEEPRCPTHGTASDFKPDHY